jgi:hypothetical protein
MEHCENKGEKSVEHVIGAVPITIIGIWWLWAALHKHYFKIFLKQWLIFRNLVVYTPV